MGHFLKTTNVKVNPQVLAPLWKLKWSEGYNLLCIKVAHADKFILKWLGPHSEAFSQYNFRSRYNINNVKAVKIQLVVQNLSHNQL